MAKIAIVQLFMSMFKTKKAKASQVEERREEVHLAEETDAQTQVADSSAEKEISQTKKTPVKKKAVKKEAKNTGKTKEAAVKPKPKTKKAAAKSTASKKETAKPKANKTTKGSKKDAKIALYAKDIKKHYKEVDKDFLAIIVKNLGPSIYRKDAELVSCSDPKELDTVRKNFLVKKLGLKLSKEELDAVIQEVCQELKGTRTKYRATFYYRLAQKFNKESALS
ncbi:DUF2853 family protein [Sulfurovum sp. NBC37-1]|uniref:DUF2853 family protein n=1 Tax=Sulfurovum sp. (strain NBC37-1) TaxID=387093 RepID=UPI00015878C4|nr:DUF2853 family protein [Sulfurovum sp. NBC37-1]BAF72013.1 hypothetical protein SUN_1056 [Sulfurovum sp. NBC37-1]